jgi:hypothetical protein
MSHKARLGCSAERIKAVSAIAIDIRYGPKRAKGGERGGGESVSFNCYDVTLAQI